MFVKDVFYSYQGEGPYIGKPQIFVRFFGCNIECAYCDEPDLPHQKVNLKCDDVLSQIHHYNGLPLHSISITGGEPLVHVAAIQELIPHISAPLYLETNATLPDALEKIVDNITYFSIDFKPHHSTAFPAFLAMLSDRSGVFVKVVLTNDTKLDDLSVMVDSIHQSCPNIPVIIQPVTPFAYVTEAVTRPIIDRAYQFLSSSLNDVRVIPQAHKMMGVK